MISSKHKIIFFSIAVIVMIIWFISPDKGANDQREYFRNLDLSITGIVKQTIPTNTHDHGVIYLEKIKSNKTNYYETLYKETFLFCKIYDDKAIIVTSQVSQIQPNDSISLNTSKNQYFIYRKGLKVDELGPWLYPEDSFYYALTVNGYLDFSYYETHHNRVQ
ncbi:MAG TPA: hypothetical protein VK668_18950 [Mucilaginibacter sp.]|nr:hypothetical protein [Mucilaginibacter sp.]